MLSNPGGSEQWPMGRQAHFSVLLNNSTAPHLLVLGGLLKKHRPANDCWLFDIDNKIWKQLVSVITLYVYM